MLTNPNDRPLRRLSDVARYLLMASSNDVLVLHKQDVDEIRELIERVLAECGA